LKQEGGSGENTNSSALKVMGEVFGAGIFHTDSLLLLIVFFCRNSATREATVLSGFIP
jgi:hypothetical protein